MVFEKTLTDVVRGIRASKRDTALYISSCIADIKREINSTDIHVKANALQKLTFLQMMGYNMSWASFASIEVMSSPRFAHKRVGYLAASQGFTQDTEVILLTTNLFKKELRGAVGGGMAGVYEAGLAVNCLSNIVTEDLARELLPELTNLTAHPQPYLRKKAVLCLFKLFVKYPQGLRLTFARVQQCLDDSNASVVSCAVNVVTELSDKNPRNYLPLAPAFFGLLTSSSNNWMLIKVVKLLGSLVPEEPRLARKLLEPLASIVRGTQAKSLLYEAVYTITLCLPYCRKPDGSMPPSVPQIVTLCAEVLRSFVEDSDQNLKYLGLVGFGSLMSSHPRVLSAPDYRPLILACLSDEDVTIRTRALDLLTGMATRKNLMELITQLLRHVDLAAGTYKSDLVSKIVEMCSADRYALLQDFAWYVDVLVRLGQTRGIERHGALISDQVVDVALRVLPVRAYAVRRMVGLLVAEGNKAQAQSSKYRHVNGEKDGNKNDTGDDHVMPEMLPAAAWIVGEYSHLITEAVSLRVHGEVSIGVFQFNLSSMGPYHSTIQALTAPSNISSIDTTAQASYVQAAVKVLAAAANQTMKQCSDQQLEACLLTLARHLPLYMESTDCEVQERAFTLYHLLDSLNLVVKTATRGGAPGLVPVEKDNDVDKSTSSSSSSSSDKGNGQQVSSSTQDLLGLVMSDPAPAAVPVSSEPIVTSDTFGNDGGTVASKCRSCAETLKYLLTPEPMKPVSAKAQKKKWRAPPASLKVDLDAPPDLSAFASLLEGEVAQRPGKGTIDTISFTHQRPPTGRDTDNGAHGAGSTDVDFARLDGMGGGANGSFQHTHGTLLQPAGTGQPVGRSEDPFYLNSATSTGDRNSLMSGDGGDAIGGQQHQEASHPSRFGAIQLLESEEESGEGGQKKRRKNKKEKKHKRKKGGTGMGATDLAVLSSATQIGMEQPTEMMPSAAPGVLAGVTVYSSGEEDGDDRLPIAATISHKAKQKRPLQTKEFEGLAKVDLTTPLREDEVMPRNEHHVVPEQQRNMAKALEVDGGAKKKKKKKGKHPKKDKRSRKEHQEPPAMAPAGTTGDLLDFSGLLGPVAITNKAAGPSTADITGGMTEAMTSATSDHNAIGSAFDDLLDLEPAPAPNMETAGTPRQSAPRGDGTVPEMSLLSLSTPQSSAKPPLSSKKGGKSRPWQRGTIKASHASQISSTEGVRPVDWGQIELHFKTHHRSGIDGLPSATLTLRIVNRMPSEVLRNALVNFDGDSVDTVLVGDVGPSGVTDSYVRAGPFQYEPNRSAPEVRGTIQASGWSTPFKLVLPSVLYLEPVVGLTQDRVLDELSSGRRSWASHSVKVEIFPGTEVGKAKGVLRSFLRANEVAGGGGDDLSGTVAAEAPAFGGALVLGLIKVKKPTDGHGGGIAKIDLKCTDASLGKALASDLKRMLL